MRTRILGERGGRRRTGNTFTECEALDVRKEGLSRLFGVKIEFVRIPVLGRRWILQVLKEWYGYGNEEKDSTLPLPANFTVSYGGSLGMKQKDCCDI